MRFLVLLLFAIGVAALGQATPDWQQMEIPGLETASTTTPTGNKAVHVRALREQRLPMHSHSADVTLTVVKGSVSMTQPGEAAKTLDASHPTTIAAGQQHELSLSNGAEIKLVSSGPITWKWANPKAVKMMRKASDVDSMSDRTKAKREQDKP